MLVNGTLFKNFWLGRSQDGPKMGMGIGQSQDWFIDDKRLGLGRSQDSLRTVPILSQERFETILGLSWDWDSDYIICGTGTVSGPS